MIEIRQLLHFTIIILEERSVSVLTNIILIKYITGNVGSGTDQQTKTKHVKWLMRENYNLGTCTHSHTK